MPRLSRPGIFLAMTFVSLTRLRIRSPWFMPGFALHTLRSLIQVRSAPGYLGGSLLADRKRAFWTMTLWRDQDDMRRYITSGAHLKAMPKLLDWCDEASVAHWTTTGGGPPSWTEAEHRMRTEGRASKVRNPSSNHQSLAFEPPRISAGLTLTPRKPA